MSKVAFVLCAGKGERWKGPTPKQLVDINGQPLLLRTVDQLKARKIPLKVVSWRPEFRKYPDYEIIEMQAMGLIQAELALSYLWNDHETVFHIYGDVYFSEHAMDLIANDNRAVACFARIGAHQPKLPVWNEIFAWKIEREGQDKYREALESAIGALQGRTVIGDAWLTFAALRRMTPDRLRQTVAAYNPNNRALFLNPLQQVPKPQDFYVQVNDETDDWDYPARFTSWRKAWGI